MNETSNSVSVPIRGTGITLEVATYPIWNDVVSMSIHSNKELFCDDVVMSAARQTRKRLGRPLACIDVGANLGSCGLWWLAERLCHQVIFYEVNPRTAKLLHRTLRQNPHLPGKAILRTTAVGDRSGDETTLFIPKGNYGHATVGGHMSTNPQIDPFHVVEEKLSVRTERLDDDEALKTMRPDLAKLDVEGRECGGTRQRRKHGLPAKERDHTPPSESSPSLTAAHDSCALIRGPPNMPFVCLAYSPQGHGRTFECSQLVARHYSFRSRSWLAADQWVLNAAAQGSLPDPGLDAQWARRSEFEHGCRTKGRIRVCNMASKRGRAVMGE